MTSSGAFHGLSGRAGWVFRTDKALSIGEVDLSPAIAAEIGRRSSDWFFRMAAPERNLSIGRDPKDDARLSGSLHNHVACRVLCIEKQFEISRVRKMIGSPVRRR